ncbi:MAG: porin family protein [Bradyrhizobium sp.]|nr:MAG: porin family protein [Bradyrhizobium sp.]
MAKFKALIIAGGALLALTRVASAADLLPPPPALEPLPPAPMEFNGWYLRGDVGLGFNAAAPSMAVSPDPLPAALLVDAASTNTFYNPTISASGIFDFGFGYQFNSWLRGDVTEEFRGGSSFQTLEVLNEPTPPASQYADFYRGNLSSYVTMINGYADLGTWYGVTPYVGLGGGFAYNKLSGMTDTGFAAVGGNPPSPVGGYLDDGGKWSFAWAAMLGLSFDVTQNLKLDLGYRYLDYGRFTSGVSHCLSPGSPSGFSCQGYTVYSKSELASNDLRIGLRWMLDTQAPPPAPLVRKY